MPNGQTVAQQRAESYERINRIEEKVDKLAEAIVALARAEEKIQTLTSFSKQQSEMIIGLGERLTKVEELVHANASTVNIINKNLPQSGRYSILTFFYTYPGEVDE